MAQKAEKMLPKI